MAKTLVGDVEYALEPLTKSLGFLTRVVQVQINERVRAAGGLHVSPAVFSTLRLIQANPGIRQVHAARILLIQESNMANLVKDLIAQGLIERREEEGKRIGLWITDKGEEEVEHGNQSDELDRSYANALSDKEYQRLLQLLDRAYRAALA
ncbi:MarR family winged helix-turn-helix transcriptional regulator [Sphingobium sp.]|uniref:MarR family winged helix-turn-helix transcriptional regulator n=1 Tax=Sphingobium sp. TaxID=1912891 RepID=UPI0028BDFD9B|nr:MarR family winged helix-turn-helix transcriptional regulator [Sphingobium sp.]